MSDFDITRYGANEIADESDFNYGETATMKNLAVFIKRIFKCTNDIVLEGLTVQQRGTPSMAVDITAGMAFCVSTEDFAHSSSLYGGVSITNGGAADRIDTLEIRLLETNYDTQQRAYIDPTTESVSYQDFETKTRYELEAQVIAGTEGAGVAPAHTAGWIKIAEISVSASETTSILDADIENVTGGYDTETTTNWTAETAVTFKIGSISNLKTLFRVSHDEDGDYTDDSIKNNHIDLGTGGSQVSAVNIPIADAGSRITASEVEGAIQELAGAGRTSESLKGNADDIGKLETDLAAQTNGNGASMVGIEDSAGKITATNVEAALAEIITNVSRPATFVYASSDSDSTSQAAADAVISTAVDAGAIITAKIATLNSAGGGSILFLEGTYNCSTSIMAGGAIIGVNIKGCGIRTLFKAGAAIAGNNAIIESSGASYCTFSDFAIDGLKATYNLRGIYGNTSDYTSKYNNIYIYDTGQQAFVYCNNLVNCIGKDTGGQAFGASNHLVNCHSINSSVSGFGICNYLSNCKVDTATDDGFNSCKNLSSCFSKDCSQYGYASCEKVSSCYAENNADGFYNSEQIHVCEANSNSRYGFNNCKQVGGCLSLLNTTAQYNNTYADSLVAQAVADTAAGGYNA